MPYQAVIFSGCILGTFLLLPYIFRARLAFGKDVDQSGSRNRKIDAKDLSGFLEAERKKIEAESSYRRHEICAEFSDSISPLLGKYFDLDKITADMERIQKKALSEREPLLSHHEAWEMFQMMGIAARLQGLLQEASRTRSDKKKNGLVNEFWALKDSLKEYRLPHAYGELAEREAFLAALDCEPEEQEEGGQDWQEEDPACTNTDSVDDPACPVARMFAEDRANSLTANPS